ncbi:hypothetical protein [Turneriella parva]|nr:hypothetical protein [Turneriella parva]
MKTIYTVTILCSILVACQMQRQSSPPQPSVENAPTLENTKKAAEKSEEYTADEKIEYEAYFYEIAEKTVYSKPNFDSTPLVKAPDNSKFFVYFRAMPHVVHKARNYFWYKVKTKQGDGWLASRSYGILPQNANLKNFQGGCLSKYGCGGCDRIDFIPGGRFEIASGCHFGFGEGTWRAQAKYIEATFEFKPSCYDSCGRDEEISVGGLNIPVAEVAEKGYEYFAEDYARQNGFSATVRFYQLRNGLFAYKYQKIRPKNRRESGFWDLPSAMRKYTKVSVEQ